jgi:D-alanine-D-alanine ligase
MKVGLTYDLRDDYLVQGFTEEETAEFDRRDTVDAIDWTLQDLGYRTDRIGNIKSLTARLVHGDRWDMVFNIAEGLRGFGREAQVPALLEAYDIPYTFSDPLVLSLTLHKAMAKHVMRDLGVPTADFALIERDVDIETVDLAFPLFAKPVGEGTGKGIDAASKIKTRSELVSVCRNLLKTYKQPVLVETFLPGREFTVGIVGTGEEARAIGTMEVILNRDAEPDAYSYVNKEKCEALVTYHLTNDWAAKQSEASALAAWKGLACRDAGRIDVRLDANGIPRVMELNPLAGLHPQHSDLCIIADKVGMTHKSLIEAIMESALKRNGIGVLPIASFQGVPLKAFEVNL